MNKQQIEQILANNLPKCFYYEVQETKWALGSETMFRIKLSPVDYSQERMNYNLQVSLAFTPSRMELHPQVFGGEGGQGFLIEPQEKYLAYSRIKVPFRTPKKNEKNVKTALTNFCQRFSRLIKENKNILTHTDKFSPEFKKWLEE